MPKNGNIDHIHSHHYAPNVKDYHSDLQITSPIRVEPNSEWQWYHKFQHWYAPLAYMTYSLYWVFIKDFVIYFSGESSPERKARWSLSCLFLGAKNRLFQLPFCIAIII